MSKNQLIKYSADLLIIDAIDKMLQCLPKAYVNINKQVNDYVQVLQQAGFEPEIVVQKSNTLEAKLIAKISREQHIESTILLLVDILDKLGSGFLYTTGSSYVYNKCYWQEISQDALKQAVRKAAIAARVPSHIASSSKFIKQLVEDINIKHFVDVTKVVRLNKINVLNYTLEIDIVTGDIYKSDFCKEDYLFYQLNYNFDEKATCPKFIEFLSEVLPKKETRNVIAEAVASVFVPNEQLKLEKMLVLYGKGANGKSVILDIITALLGDANVSNIGVSALTTNDQARAGVRNKLLNIDTEMTAQYQRINYEELKKMISGEPIQVKLLYKDPFKINDYARLISACNELPPHEHTNAFARRLVIVPFNVTIPEDKQNKQLAQQIKETELSGVLNWVLLGLVRLLKQKNFTQSTEIVEAIKEYAVDSDSVQLFLKESLKMTPAVKDKYDTTYGLLAIFRMYNTYCGEAGLKPVSRRTMEKRLIAAGCGRIEAGFTFKIIPENLTIEELPI